MHKQTEQRNNRLESGTGVHRFTGIDRSGEHKQPEPGVPSSAVVLQLQLQSEHSFPIAVHPAVHHPTDQDQPLHLQRVSAAVSQRHFRPDYAHPTGNPH